MNNPIALFRNLRDLYRRYLDSPLAIRYDALRDERRALLDQDRRLWREPLIEPMSAYHTCGTDFSAVAHELLDESWGNSAAEELAEFLGPSLFPDHRQPYSHQHEVFYRTLVEHRDAVVTTGTGSGKTECFLVPVLAELVRESRQWSAPSPR
jgi:DEAD/DEAH box helicase domain-containing protein